MTKNKKLLLLLLIFAVLLGGYLIIKTVMEKQEETQDQIAVTQINTAEIEKLLWNDGTESNALVFNNGTWQYEGDEAFPVDQKYPQEMLEMLSDIKAERSVETGDDLSQYGLDKPKLTITAVKKDASSTVIAIGDTNEVTSTSYMQLDGGSIFMIDSALANAFDYSKDALIQNDEMPEVGEANRLEVISGASSVIVEKSEDTWKIGETVLDTDKVEQVLSKISQLTLTNYDTYQADDALKSQYGVTPETGSKVIVTYPGEDNIQQEVVFYIGNYASNQYHLYMEGSKLIYKISETDAEAIVSVSEETLKPDDTEATQSPEPSEETAE